MERKARIVFGDVLPQVTAEAKRNATQMGLTTAEYIGAAASIQDLLVPMGFQRKAAADISTQLVNLSGALSEWSNGQRSATEVSHILNKALLGEREELKSLGISISEADVKARLAEKGLSKLTGKMLEQAEAAATLELILEKSVDAQTAFADNAGSNTRRVAEMTARFEELKERLATGLIPVFEGLLNVTEDAGVGFGIFIENIGKVDDTVRDLGKTLSSRGLVERLYGWVFGKDGPEFVGEDAAKEFWRGFGEFAPAQPKGVFKFGSLGAGQDPDASLKQAADKAAADDKAKKDRDKNAKEAVKLQEKLRDLVERTAEFRADLQAKADEDELSQAVRAIEKRYDAEIKKALELESKGVHAATAQRIALEHLKQDEIGLAVQEATSKAVEDASKLARENALKVAEAEATAQQEAQDWLDQRQEERKDAEAEITQFKNEGLLSEREQEIAELETHYQKLLDLADDYGIDTTNLREAYEKKKLEIDKKSREKQLENQRALQSAQIELEQARLSALSDGAGILASFFEESSGMAKALFLFQKGIAAAEVLVNLQVEIAKIAAANASLGVAGIPITAAQVAAAKIRAGIGLGAIAATAVKEFIPPKTKQKFEGRYLQVTGETDGRQYNAQYIGKPETGMLPNFPVLLHSKATGGPVLASERGAEYFVAAHDLANPYVANLVRMIDNITVTGRLPQFADGGLNTAAAATPATTAPGGSELATLVKANMEVMGQLVAVLNRGIPAVVGDQATVEIMKRFSRINQASGGYYDALK